MTMKKSFLKYLLILPAALWLLAACTREGLPEAEGDRIPVRLSLALPDGQAVKSSLVPYGTDAVSSMWLLCFNQVGSCVDCIEATVSGSSITATPGISRDTRSIHFIANKNLTAVKESVIGRQERNVLESITVSKDESVTFWGYFHGHTTAEVRDFVNAGSPATVYLLRDRAKLVGGTISDSNIDSIQWIVTRGLSEGYAVPYPYDNYYRLEGGRYYGNTAVTAKNGWKKGGVIHIGSTGVGIGGGICHTSSLTYFSVISIPVFIYEREPHTDDGTHYMPVEFDATVGAWSDFIYYNILPYDIKQHAFVDPRSGAITVYYECLETKTKEEIENFDWKTLPIPLAKDDK